MIKYTINGITTHVTKKLFKDGAVNANINCGSEPVNFEVDSVFIDARISSNDDIMLLAQVNYALRQQYPRASIGLFMPYVMYGRQDRACNAGEANAIKVFGKMINDMGFGMVAVVDPHSIATEAVINNVQIVDQVEVFGNIKLSFREWTIVAPDAGATKKCEAFAKRVGAAGVLTFNKVRDMETVEITSLQPNTPIKINGAGKYLILDDICDGGRTFIQVADAIGSADELATIELAVTHGIFSYGVDIVTDKLQHVYTTDSFRQDLVSSDKLTVIKL